MRTLAQTIEYYRKFINGESQLLDWDAVKQGLAALERIKQVRDGEPFARDKAQLPLPGEKRE